MIWSFAAWAVRFFEFLLPLFPRRVVDGTAVCLGLVLWHGLRVRRNVVVQNLRIAYPEWTEETRLWMGRASFISFCRTVFEFLDAPRVIARARIEKHGEEILDRALAQGKGVYVLCCHLGNWELMCQYGSLRFGSVHVVVKPVGKQSLAAHIDKMRLRRGMTVIQRGASDRKATMDIFRALRTGELVGFMADQRRARGTLAPFFGRECHTNDSLLQLWMRREAPVVPVSLVRIGLDHFRFVVWPELEPVRDKIGQDAVLQNTIHMNKALERMIDVRPDQYFWLHRRWKGFESVAAEPRTPKPKPKLTSTDQLHSQPSNQT